MAQRRHPRLGQPWLLGLVGALAVVLPSCNAQLAPELARDATAAPPRSDGGANDDGAVPTGDGGGELADASCAERFRSCRACALIGRRARLDAGCMDPECIFYCGGGCPAATPEISGCFVRKADGEAFYVYNAGWGPPEFELCSPAIEMEVARARRRDCPP